MLRTLMEFFELQFSPFKNCCCLFSWLLFKSQLMELVKVPAVPASFMYDLSSDAQDLCNSHPQYTWCCNSCAPVGRQETETAKSTESHGPADRVHTDCLKLGGRWELLPEVVLWPPPLTPPQTQFSLNSSMFRKELEQLTL